MAYLRSHYALGMTHHEFWPTLRSNLINQMSMLKVYFWLNCVLFGLRMDASVTRRGGPCWYRLPEVYSINVMMNSALKW